MVPIAKGAILLVLLGGATVSTYAVANGGFGNKAKSAEKNKQEGANGGDKSGTPGQNGEIKDSPQSAPTAQGEGGVVGGESTTGRDGVTSTSVKGEVDSTSLEGSSRPEAVRAQEAAGEGNTQGNAGSTNSATNPVANVEQQ